MRISDWSSDVCSSDLEEGNFIVQAIDPATAQHTDTTFNWAFVSFENPIEFEGTDGLGTPDIVMPDDQILPPIDPLNFATACIDSYTPREDRNSIYASTDDTTLNRKDGKPPIAVS